MPPNKGKTLPRASWTFGIEGPNPHGRGSPLAAPVDYLVLLAGPAIRGLADDDVLVVVSTGGRPASAVPGPVPAYARIAEFLPCW